MLWMIHKMWLLEECEDEDGEENEKSKEIIEIESMIQQSYDQLYKLHIVYVQFYKNFLYFIYDFIRKNPDLACLILNTIFYHLDFYRLVNKEWLAIMILIQYIIKISWEKLINTLLHDIKESRNDCHIHYQILIEMGFLLPRSFPL